jgi:hypothetical protein
MLELLEIIKLMAIIGGAFCVLLFVGFIATSNANDDE